MTRAQSAIVAREVPQRIQRRRARGWRMPADTICVTRPGPWGNPFVVGRDGTQEDCMRLYATLLAGSLCVSAKASLEDQLAARRYVVDHIGDLRGKNLACFCRIGTPCHADVLLKVAANV